MQAGRRWVLPDGDDAAGGEIDRLEVLDEPASLSEHRVDVRSGLLLRSRHKVTE